MGFFQRRLVVQAGPMNGYNFTERVRMVLAMAREEAARLRHEYVGTEHILLGLVREGAGVAAAVLANLGADAGALRQRTLAALNPGAARGKMGKMGQDVPYTSRAKKALELAMAEARGLDHTYVGTEHLLLGLLGEERGIAAQMLVASAVTLEGARVEVRRLLNDAAPAADAAPSPAPAPTIGPRGGPGPGEAQAWQRLLHALDVTARLGGTPSVTLEGDGSLTVSLGPDLVVSVALPSDARVRPREG